MRRHSDLRDETERYWTSVDALFDFVGKVRSGGRFRICFTEIMLTRHRQYLVSREGGLAVFVRELERVHAEIRESGVAFRV